MKNWWLKNIKLGKSKERIKLEDTINKDDHPEMLININISSEHNSINQLIIDNCRRTLGNNSKKYKIIT